MSALRAGSAGSRPFSRIVKQLMRRRHFARREHFALPSSFEEIMGAVWSPVGHEAEIEAAASVLHCFASDLEHGRTPESTLDSIANAADTLCKFGGCPTEAFSFVEYLSSPECTSYRNVAEWLRDFVPEMSELIAWRLDAAAQSSRAAHRPHEIARASDEDLPF